MPGLIAVLGDRAPEATLRRAAEPLLRRPWHSLELVSSPEDGFALGFAGANGGVARDPVSEVVVALDGEVVVGDRIQSGTAAAERLAERYGRAAVPGDLPDGHFAACIWDPRSRVLRVVADRLGHRPAYVTRDGGAHLIAGELKALVAAGLAPALDLSAVAELLAYEYLLGEHTLLEGVRLVPPGATLVLRPDGSEHLEEWWRYRLEPDDSVSDEALVDGFARLLRQSVRRRLEPDTALALSGGLDSRAIASVLRRDAPETLAVSYGTPGSDDLVLGTRVARSAGLRHRSLPLSTGYLARDVPETVWLTEGQIRCLHAHHLALGRLRDEEGLGSLLIGFLGDTVVRGGSIPVPEGGEPALAAQLDSLLRVMPGELEEQLLAPQFAASIRGRARESLAAHLAQEDGSPVARRRQFVWRHEVRRKVIPGAFLFADDLAPRDPFADHELIDFCRRLPDRARVRGSLESAYLRRFPELARIRSPKAGVAPGLSGRRELVARRLVSDRRRVEGWVERTAGPRWMPSRRGIGDYATDLRRGSADLLGMLLEERTLARGQLREETVRRLVDETLRGRARHTRPLGLLLTLELFQRQFLDGDGFSRPAPFRKPDPTAARPAPAAGS